MSSSRYYEECKRAPKAPSPRLHLSRSLEKEGKNEEAFNEAIVAVELLLGAPNFPVEAKLDTFEQLARTALLNKHRLLAEIVARYALSLGTPNVLLYCRLAQSLIAQNRWDEARQVIDYALRVNPRYDLALKLHSVVSAKAA